MKDAWRLPPELQDSTGVLYASSYPGLDAAVAEVMKYCESKKTTGCTVGKLMRELRRRLEFANGDELGSDDEAAFRQLEALATLAKRDNPAPYEFDRKFLFKVLCLGNSQLAQIVGAKGPNAQTNAACAGTTQAVAIAVSVFLSLDFSFLLSFFLSFSFLLLFRFFLCFCSLID